MPWASKPDARNSRHGHKRQREDLFAEWNCRLSWEDSKLLRSGELALALVERAKSIRLQSKRARHMKKIKRSGAEFRAVTPGERQYFFPNLRTERCGAKNSGGLMLQKKIADGPRLPPGPFLPEYSEF